MFVNHSRNSNVEMRQVMTTNVSSPNYKDMKNEMEEPDTYLKFMST